MNIKSYALSVCVIIVITELSDLLLPSGKMKNVTRTVFSIMTVLVFASPVITFFKKDFDVSNLFESEQVEIDEDFIDYSNQVRENMFSDIAKNALRNQGIDNAEVDVFIENFSGVVNIKKVEINFSKSVIIDESWHIYKTKARSVVATALDIDEKVVTIVE